MYEIIHSVGSLGLLLAIEMFCSHGTLLERAILLLVELARSKLAGKF